MASLRSPIRFWPTLLAAVVLSALSAAEATLAAAPLFDAADSRGDWPAQLTPVKDRDSVNLRTARPSDHQEDRFAPQSYPGGVALLTAWQPPHRLALRGNLTIAARPVFAAAQLPPHRLGLPPPML